LSDRIPKPGEIYKHFKNKLYQVITVAIHSETGEEMVVYQALYGDFSTYVRPLTMFISEVDKAKYPDSKQKYRFELVNMKEEKDKQNDFTKPQESMNLKDNLEQPFNQFSEYQHNTKITGIEEHQINKEIDKLMRKTEDKFVSQNEEVGEVSSILLDFLDAKSYEEKLIILTSNKKHMDDKLINDMAASIDCTVEEGTLEERFNGLLFCLQTFARFENSRLR
jgi:hypothetical protein